jgi:hypothetical protein
MFDHSAMLIIVGDRQFHCRDPDSYMEEPMSEPKIHLDEVRLSNIVLADTTHRADQLGFWVDLESLQHIIDGYLDRMDSIYGHSTLTAAFTDGFLLGMRFQDAGGHRPDDRSADSIREAPPYPNRTEKRRKSL